MKYGTRRIALVWVVALVLVTDSFCFCLGTRLEAARNRSERELDILLSRSELEGLGDIEGRIYVTGHKSPDADTVCSAIAYAALLERLGYDAVPAVLGDINAETAYLLQAAGADTPALLEDATGLNMVLVDHGDYAQSAPGLEQANILSIIDHHGDGSVETGNPIIYDARPLGSAATIVWMRYRGYGVEPDRQTAFLLAGAILSDTRSFENNTTTTADREAVEALCALAGITDRDALYREMYKLSISYEGMTDEEIFYSDYKEYESAGKSFSVGCISVYDEADAREMSERMRQIVPSSPAETGVDLAFAQINILHDGISMTFLVPSDESAAAVIERAFPDAAFDGTAFKFEPGMSRKQVLVPAVTAVLVAEGR